jgi:hypothetical protein
LGFDGSAVTPGFDMYPIVGSDIHTNSCSNDLLASIMSEIHVYALGFCSNTSPLDNCTETKRFIDTVPLRQMLGEYPGLLSSRHDVIINDHESGHGYTLPTLLVSATVEMGGIKHHEQIFTFSSFVKFGFSCCRS